MKLCCMCTELAITVLKIHLCESGGGRLHSTIRCVNNSHDHASRTAHVVVMLAEVPDIDYVVVRERHNHSRYGCHPLALSAYRCDVLHDDHSYHCHAHDRM